MTANRRSPSDCTSMKPSITLAIALCISFAMPLWAGVDVLTSRNDAGRTGANLSETLLTTFNVNSSQFGLLFSYNVQGNVFAQPLVAMNVMTLNGMRNIVYVATTDDIVYAFDAECTSANGGPIWQANLATEGTTPILEGDTVNPVPFVFTGNIGIVGTPVIDRSRGTLYVVARTKEKATGYYVQSLHALDIANGHDRPGSPAIIARQPLSWDRSTLSFAAIQNQRAGLGLVKNRIIIAWGGGTMEGAAPLGMPFWARYRGYVIVYDADTLLAVGCFTPTPGYFGAHGAGIWQSGRGPVIDSDGYVYYQTGNTLGTPDRPEPLGKNQCGFLTPGLPWQHEGDLTNSLIKLDVRQGLSLVEHAAPKRYRKALDDCDLDLSGSGPLLVPGTSTLIVGGKQGFLHVFDKRRGKYTEVSSEQVYDGPLEQYYDEHRMRTAVPCQSHGQHHLMGGPVYWESASKGRLIFVSAESDEIKAFKFGTSAPVFFPDDDDLPVINRSLPLVMKTGQKVLGHPAAILSLSANGKKEGTGILWAVHADWHSPTGNHDVIAQKTPGILRAFDAEDLSHELWNSDMSTKDLLGLFAKFTPPTIANGKVYMATFSGKVNVYGLLNAGKCLP